MFSDIVLFTDSGNSYGQSGAAEAFTCQYSNYSELTIAASIFWGEEELTTIDVAAQIGKMF